MFRFLFLALLALQGAALPQSVTDDMLISHLTQDTVVTQKSQNMLSDETKAEDADRLETIRKLKGKLEASEGLLKAMDAQLATITEARNNRLTKINELRKVISGFDGEASVLQLESKN